MVSKSIIFFCVVALVLPAIFGEETITKSCIYDSESVLNAFSFVEKCFKEIVQEHIGNTSPTHECRNVNDFATKFENFRKQAIKSCIPTSHQELFISRKKHLIDFLTFSLSGDKFKTEFYAKNGLECIKKHKDALETCVTDASGYERDVLNVKKYDPKFWLQLNRPTYTLSACDITEEIKTCVSSLILNDKVTCNKSIADYIIGLFDFLLNICKRLAPKS